MATPRRAFLLIFLVHLGVQGLFLTKVPTQWVLPHSRFEVSARTPRSSSSSRACASLSSGSGDRRPPGRPRISVLTLLSAVGACGRGPG